MKKKPSKPKRKPTRKPRLDAAQTALAVVERVIGGKLADGSSHMLSTRKRD
jgi:hypothetical protein